MDDRDRIGSFLNIFCSLWALVLKFLSVNRGLFGRLALPLSTFVLVASLSLAIWISWLHRKSSVAEFQQTAATNAEFMREVPLPLTAQSAKRLSFILEVDVGFLLPDGELIRDTADNWPKGDLSPALTKAIAPEPVFLPYGDHDLALAPLQQADHYLILSRPKEGGLTGMGTLVLVPTLALTACCGVLVFLLAHRIVRPLALLSDWLPNLQRDRDEGTAIPTTVSERSDEIGELARSLEDTHQRLLEEQELRQRSERLATLGRIATSLAHEIRNPAAAIRMHADLLKHTEAVNSEESINLIGEEVDRITDLVNQWLFVARAAPPETRSHQLSELVEAVARRLGPSLAHAKVTLYLDLSPPDTISCDRLRMEQVIRNLLVNALQAMPEGGTVTAKTRTNDGSIAFTVTDEGTGFSEEALDRFGEAFFSEREGGMGIGLTLAREVVEAHGGNIEAQNNPVRGASVTIYLPEHQNSETA